MQGGLWPSAQATASQLLLHAAWQLYSWHVYHTQSILAKTLVCKIALLKVLIEGHALWRSLRLWAGLS